MPDLYLEKRALHLGHRPTARGPEQVGPRVAVEGEGDQPGERQCGQPAVCRRRRSASVGGGTHSTPRPAQTSWPCRASSSPPRGTKSAGGRVLRAGSPPDDRRGAVGGGGHHRGEDARRRLQRLGQLRGVPSGPASTPVGRVVVPPAQARKNAGASTVSTVWSAVRAQLHSNVPAGADQSRSAPARHAAATSPASSPRSSRENPTGGIVRTPRRRRRLGSRRVHVPGRRDEW